MDRDKNQDILSVYYDVKEKGTFEYLRVLDEFKKSEYYNFYHFLKRNRQVLSILRHNYTQLVSLVDYHNSPENQSKIWNDTNPKYRWRQQRMITTQLFNYLTSVFATVDYSRSKVRKYISLNPEISSNITQGIETYFENSPQHKFIQSLRNYTSHNSYLRVSTELKANFQEKSFERNVYLLKEELLNSSKWSGLSKDFLELQGDKVYIIDIIKSHFPLFIDFQNWTYLALLQVNHNFTLKFRDQLQSILEFAEKVNMARTSLPYNSAYLRYLDQIIKESTYRCSYQFEYVAPTPQV